MNYLALQVRSRRCVGVVVDSAEHEVVEVAACAVYREGTARLAVCGRGAAVDASAILGDFGDTPAVNVASCV